MLPPPMFPGNDGVPDALCINPGHDFKLLVTAHEVRTRSHRHPCMTTRCVLGCCSNSSSMSLLGLAMIGACLAIGVIYHQGRQTLTAVQAIDVPSKGSCRVGCG